MQHGPQDAPYDFCIFYAGAKDTIKLSKARSKCPSLHLALFTSK